MRPIQVKQLDYDLTPTAGLALVGHFLKTLAPVLADVDASLPVRTGVATSDIVRSYLGLLVQGKSDFDAIENLRGDKFFKQALGIGLLPRHSVAIRTDSTLWAWGEGFGIEPRRLLEGVVAVAAGNTATIALRADGSLLQWDGGAGPRRLRVL